jgi:hypothetical protein
MKISSNELSRSNAIQSYPRGKNNEKGKTCLQVMSEHQKDISSEQNCELLFKRI